MGFDLVNFLHITHNHGKLFNPSEKVQSQGLLISKLPNDIFLSESLNRNYSKDNAWKTCEDKDIGKM